MTQWHQTIPVFCVTLTSKGHIMLCCRNSVVFPKALHRWSLAIWICRRHLLGLKIVWLPNRIQPCSRHDVFDFANVFCLHFSNDSNQLMLMAGYRSPPSLEIIRWAKRKTQVGAQLLKVWKTEFMITQRDFDLAYGYLATIFPYRLYINVLLFADLKWFANQHLKNTEKKIVKCTHFERK